MKRSLAFGLALFSCGLAGSLGAEPVLVDRAVVRFEAPETGGARRPRFVFERELAFEARLEALSDPDRAALGDLAVSRSARDGPRSTGTSPKPSWACCGSNPSPRQPSSSTRVSSRAAC